LLAWTPTLPPFETSAWLAPAALVWIVSLFVLAGHLKTKRGVRTGFTRKFLHFGIFGAACGLSIALDVRAVNLLGGIGAVVIAFAIWRGEGHPFYEAIARESDTPRRTMFVVVPFAATVAGGIASSWLFGPLAAVGYLVAGCGDAIAEPVGLRWGRHRYRTPSFGTSEPTERSIEGSASVFVVSLIAAFVLFTQAALGVDTTSQAATIALAVAGAATIIEAVSPHGLDNLTVQLAAAGTAFALA